MSDSSHHIVKMARQIADFFRAYPEARAVPEIAAHINKFWTRRMRDDLLAVPGLREGAVDPLLGKAAALVRPGRPSAGQDVLGQEKTTHA